MSHQLCCQAQLKATLWEQGVRFVQMLAWSGGSIGTEGLSVNIKSRRFGIVFYCPFRTARRDLHEVCLQYWSSTPNNIHLSCFVVQFTRIPTQRLECRQGTSTQRCETDSNNALESESDRKIQRFTSRVYMIVACGKSRSVSRLIASICEFVVHVSFTTAPCLFPLIFLLSSNRRN